MTDDETVDDDLEADVAAVISALDRRRRPYAVGGDVIERTVRECFAEHQNARIRDFVGLLVERSAHERLQRMSAEAVAGGGGPQAACEPGGGGPRPGPESGEGPPPPELGDTGPALRSASIAPPVPGRQRARQDHLQRRGFSSTQPV